MTSGVTKSANRRHPQTQLFPAATANSSLKSRMNNSFTCFSSLGVYLFIYLFLRNAKKKNKSRCCVVQWTVGLLLRASRPLLLLCPLGVSLGQTHPAMESFVQAKLVVKQLISLV